MRWEERETENLLAHATVVDVRGPCCTCTSIASVSDNVPSAAKPGRDVVERNVVLY